MNASSGGRRRAGITALGAWVPPTVLDNATLETFVETSDEWIIERTGIRERRILVEKELSTSDMAVWAAEEALRHRGLAPEKVDLIICATVTPDHVFPATANVIADKLGARNAWGFDLEAACSSFLYGLVLGARLIESGQCEHVLVIGADRMSSIINYEDRTTCVIFGDGAGAVLLEPVPDEKVGIFSARLYSDGSGRHALHQIAGGAYRPPSIETVLHRDHFVYQEGRTVFAHAVRKMAEVVQEVAQIAGLDLHQDPVWLIPHQANLRIIRAVASALQFPMDRVTVNIHRYGNTTSATLPLCLYEWQDEFQYGDHLILTTFGGGFTWGAVHIRWALPLPSSGKK